MTLQEAMDETSLRERIEEASGIGRDAVIRLAGIDHLIDSAKKLEPHETAEYGDIYSVDGVFYLIEDSVKGRIISDLLEVAGDQFYRTTRSSGILRRKYMVYNLTESNSALLQEHLFQLGYSWAGYRSVQYARNEEIVIGGDGYLTHTPAADTWELAILIDASKAFKSFCALLVGGETAARAESSAIVSDELYQMIYEMPGLPNTRGRIRRELGLVVPHEVMGETGRIVEWIKEQKGPVEKHSSVYGTSRPGRTTLTQPRRPRVETRGVDFRVEVDVSGTTYFSRRDVYEDTMQVPVSVIAEGSEAVEEYIQEHYRDYECHYGDDEYGDSNDDDWDINEITSEAERVCEEYEQENAGDDEDEDEDEEI